MDIHVEPRFWDWPLQGNDGVVKVHNDEEKFYVDLDAQHFLPNEIQVNVIGHNLDIHCEHKSRSESFGDVSRSVTRSYRLPDDVDVTSVKSVLSPRGTLNIRAEKKAIK